MRPPQSSHQVRRFTSQLLLCFANSLKQIPKASVSFLALAFDRPQICFVLRERLGKRFDERLNLRLALLQVSFRFSSERAELLGRKVKKRFVAGS